jgi:hypothetical protein
VKRNQNTTVCDCPVLRKAEITMSRTIIRHQDLIATLMLICLQIEDDFWYLHGFDAVKRLV